jgi:hypothetical protein
MGMRDQRSTVIQICRQRHDLQEWDIDLAHRLDQEHWMLTRCLQSQSGVPHLITRVIKADDTSGSESPTKNSFALCPSREQNSGKYTCYLFRSREIGARLIHSESTTVATTAVLLRFLGPDPKHRLPGKVVAEIVARGLVITFTCLTKARYAAQGSMTILVTLSFLSRQILYSSGARSSPMRWEII